jgi:hypothetical protein
MRDPTAVNDPRVEEAVEAACAAFRSLKELGWFPKKLPDEPDALLRYRAHDVIKGLPDEVMPAHLRDYVCGLLSKTPEGLRRTYAASRDQYIAEIVDDMVRRGFPATRNDATRAKESRGASANQSASSIVAKALARIDVNVSERSVEDIWARSYAESPEKSG